MQCVLSAESAILACLHPVRMILFLFCHVVVPLFALGTCQCDLYAHDFHLRLFLIDLAAFLCGFDPRESCRFLGIKKKPTSIRPTILSWGKRSVKDFLILWTRCKCWWFFKRTLAGEASHRVRPFSDRCTSGHGPSVRASRTPVREEAVL